MKKFALIPTPQWEDLKKYKNLTGLDKDILAIIERKDLDENGRIGLYRELLLPNEQIGMGNGDDSTVKEFGDTSIKEGVEDLPSLDITEVKESDHNIKEHQDEQVITELKDPQTIDHLEVESELKDPTPPPPGIRESHWRENWISFK
jgi:hypothetical protein